MKRAITRYLAVGLTPTLCLLGFFGFLALTEDSKAAPAAQESYELDIGAGSIMVSNQGDEWSNWVETEEGFTIAPDTSGVYYYVERYVGNRPVLSDAPVTAVPPPGMGKRVQPERIPLLSRMPPAVAPAEPAKTVGEYSGNLLFILVEFNDWSGNTSESSWGDHLQNVDDYFSTVSYGKVSQAPAAESYGLANNGVVGWLTLDQNHPHVGGNIDVRSQQLSKDAILAADPYVDYAAYDFNGDGHVGSDELSVVVVVAGPETAYGGSLGTWGHAWVIWNVSPPVVDGVIVGAWHRSRLGYAQFGEMHGSHQATVGIMVHELGHLTFGLPDLYDTDGSSHGIGVYGVMGQGSWGRAQSEPYPGQTPVMPSAWVRQRLEWSNTPEGDGPQTLVAAGDTTANVDNTVLSASFGDPWQYFLVENRQPIGYDRGLQRYLGTAFGGLAIWHIDESQSSNTNDARRWVDLEHADDTESRSPLDLWYLGNATTFNDFSTPNSRDYSDNPTGVDINSIGASGTVMSVHFGAQAPSDPELFSPVPDSTLDGNSAHFEWRANGADITRWQLRVGSTHPGSFDIFKKAFGKNVTAATVYGLPIDGSTLYVRLRYQRNGAWSKKDYVYTATSASVSCNGITATVVGTPGDDVITGTSGVDVINGLAGNDTIYGLGGNDIICGGKGADMLYGGGGRDDLYGEKGPDQLFGDYGWDRLFGGEGPDELFGGNGRDMLFGENGDDTMAGGPGTDNCDGGGGSGDFAYPNCENTFDVP